MKHQLKFSLLLCLFIISNLLQAQTRNAESIQRQEKRVANQPVFQINNPDYKLSPKTGMTRNHWKAAALYLLKGAFSYVDKLEDPMQFPKLPGKSYPVSENRIEYLM